MVKQITSPGWMHETSAQGWCTGKIQRDGMGWRGRWEGGSEWGTHVNPWLIHVSIWQKPLQYCKVISLQLIKINEKKKYWSGLPCPPPGDLPYSSYLLQIRFPSFLWLLAGWTWDVLWGQSLPIRKHIPPIFRSLPWANCVVSKLSKLKAWG